MKHTEQTRAKMSIKSKAAWAMRTAEENAKLIRKRIASAFANGTLIRPRKTTWKSAWREIDGQRRYFRSRWEANYARFLGMLRGAGDITAWEHEPQVFYFEGIRRGCVSYLPDFRVTMPDGSVEFHEVKGWMDARSATKIRRMAKYHPDVRLIVVTRKEYESLERTAGRFIPGWEA